MVSEIFTAANSIKTTIDILKTLVNTRDTSMINGAVTEIRTHLISVQNDVLKMQSENAALISSKRNLEEKIMKLENWEQEKARYGLSELAPSIYVYTLKNEEVENSEPVHHICANCYNNGIKSILHKIASCPINWEKWKCFTCTFEVAVGKKTKKSLAGRYSRMGN